MKSLKQFIIPVIFIVAMSLIFKLSNMGDGLGKFSTYFIIALIPTLIIQLNNIKKSKEVVTPAWFLGMLVAYTFITLTFSGVVLVLLTSI